mgnify:CR=1 FL=1
MSLCDTSVLLGVSGVGILARMLCHSNGIFESF